MMTDTLLDISVTMIAVIGIATLVVVLLRRADRDDDLSEIKYLRDERDVLLAKLHQCKNREASATREKMTTSSHHCPLAVCRDGHTSPCVLSYRHDGRCSPDDVSISIVIDAPSDALMADAVDHLARHRRRGSTR